MIKLNFELNIILEKLVYFYEINLTISLIINFKNNLPYEIIEFLLYGYFRAFLS